MGEVGLIKQIIKNGRGKWEGEVGIQKFRLTKKLSNPPRAAPTYSPPSFFDQLSFFFFLFGKKTFSYFLYIYCLNFIIFTV